MTAAALERVREYWDSRPCNIRHSPLPVGTREYFDQVEARKYIVEPHIPVFANFDRWHSKKVLEIGCGIGTDTVNFARAGADVIACDLSMASLDLAKQRAALYGLDIRFFQADAERLAENFAPEHTFDLIYSFGVIHHSPHPDEILRQAAQLLKPRGELRVMIYHRRSWKVAWIIARYGLGRFWKAEQLVAKHSEAQTGCPITYTYTRRSAREMFEAAGFEVTRMSVDHIFPYRIRDYVKYRHIKTWYWRLVPAPMMRWLERRFGWHLLVTARLR